MEEIVPKMTESGQISPTSNSLETKKIQCSECGKLFKTNVGFRIHFNNFHSNEKNFKCEHCTEEFRYKSSLRNDTQ